MAEDVEARDPLDLHQAKHVFGDVFRIISIIGLVAVRVAPQIRSDKDKTICKPFNDWEEFAVVLRPAMHAQNRGAAACRYIMQIDAICFSAFVRAAGALGWNVVRASCARRSFFRGLRKSSACCVDCRGGDRRPGDCHGGPPIKLLVSFARFCIILVFLPFAGSELGHVLIQEVWPGQFAPKLTLSGFPASTADPSAARRLAAVRLSIPVVVEFDCLATSCAFR